MIPLPPWLSMRLLKLVGIGAVVLALVGGFLWYRHSLIAQGDAAGSARVQARWDAANAKQQAIVDAKVREIESRDAADAARNLEIANAYEKELALVAADTDRYRRLLQRAREAATASGRPAPEVADQSGAAEASTSRSSEPTDLAARIDAATADLIAEARANAGQLDALIAEVVPQQ
jgi:hypothetical protein